MLITAILIKAYDKGPVFYKQARVTKDGKVFDIIKFRSMIPNAEADGKSRPAVSDDDLVYVDGVQLEAPVRDGAYWKIPNVGAGATKFERVSK